MTTLGFLSTYPPTRCGLAQLTASLRDALPPATVGEVVRYVEAPGEPLPPGVVGELVAGSASGCRRAAALLDRHDVVLVQYADDVHPAMDTDVLRVLAALTVPAVLVLHTVPAAPNAHRRRTLNRMALASAAVVTMSEVARTRLVDAYDVPANRVHVIPPGSPDHTSMASATPHRNQRRQILTWGLLGPGMGAEWGIEAMALLRDLSPEPRYLIAGCTHSRVLQREGESYRNLLASRAERLGLTDSVRFEPHHLGPAALRRTLARAELVLLPYDARDQVTSSVLVEAVSSRTPVVATRFPHAVELLSGGAGVLVDHQDPVAMADAIRLVLGDRSVASRMASAAGIAAAPLAWASVARRYRALAADVVSAGTSVVA